MGTPIGRDKPDSYYDNLREQTFQREQERYNEQRFQNVFDDIDRKDLEARAKEQERMVAEAIDKYMQMGYDRDTSITLARQEVETIIEEEKFNQRRN